MSSKEELINEIERKLTYGIEGVFLHKKYWTQFLDSCQNKNCLELKLLNCILKFNCKEYVDRFLLELPNEFFENIQNIEASNIEDIVSLEVFIELIGKLNRENEIHLWMSPNKKWNNTGYVGKIIQKCIEKKIKIVELHAFESIFTMEDIHSWYQYCQKPYCKIEFLNIGKSIIYDWSLFFQGLIYQKSNIQRIWMNFLNRDFLVHDFYVFLGESFVLREIQFSNVLIQNEEFVQICEALKVHKSIRELLFDSNHISNIGPLSLIGDVLEVIQWSNRIGVDWNLFVDSLKSIQILNLYEPAPYTIKESWMIENDAFKLSCKDIDYLFDKLMNNRTIKTIILRHFSYNMKDVKLLSSFISKNRSIQKLCLSKELNNDILDNLIFTILHTPDISLRSLSIGAHKKAKFCYSLIKSKQFYSNLLKEIQIMDKHNIIFTPFMKIKIKEYLQIISHDFVMSDYF